MKEKFIEAAKDAGFGIALVAGIGATFAGLIATPLFIYFCWAFGGLTRSILNRD
jgi:hypothetical protein